VDKICVCLRESLNDDFLHDFTSAFSPFHRSTKYGFWRSNSRPELLGIRFHLIRRRVGVLYKKGIKHAAVEGHDRLHQVVPVQHGMMVGRGKVVERPHPSSLAKRNLSASSSAMALTCACVSLARIEASRGSNSLTPLRNISKNLLRIGGRALFGEFVIRTERRNRLRTGAVEPPRFVTFKTPK